MEAVDIEYIRQGLSIDDSQLDLLSYKNSRSCYRHREEILTNLGVAPFSSRQQELLSVEAKRMARNQTKPTLILDALVNYLLEHQMEVPSYYTLKTILQEALDSFEAELLAILDRSLRREDAQLLDDLLSKQQVYQERIGASSSVQRYELTFFKRIPQSMRPGEIKKRVEMFQELKRMHGQLWPVINRLDLSPATVRYYAEYVIDTQTSQLKINAAHRNLWLIAFIIHQYLSLGDALVITLHRAVTNALSVCGRQLKEDYFRQSRLNTQLATQVSSRNSNHITVLQKIEAIVNDAALSNENKVLQIQSLYHQMQVNSDQLQEDRKRLQMLTEIQQARQDNEDYYLVLEKQSIKLQNRVSAIVEHLVLMKPLPVRTL